MTYSPTVNEFDLELTVKALEIVNPGRASAAHIRDMIRDHWPFDNLSTAGWVAYAESPRTNNNVRVALTPYSVNKYLEGV